MLSPKAFDRNPAHTIYGAIRINAVGIVHRSTFLPFTSSCCFGIKSANTPPMKIPISNHHSFVNVLSFSPVPFYNPIPSLFPNFTILKYKTAYMHTSNPSHYFSPKNLYL